jgi:DNA-binding response OmpR family regulator
MMNMAILLVEDDLLLGDGIKSALVQAEFTVDWVEDGHKAQWALENVEYSLIVLDLGLPKLSGIDVLRELRGSGSKLPVLILTARDKVEDRVSGLNAGGDDYLTKPFEISELIARIRALVRRASGYAAGELRHGELIVNLEARTASFRGKPIDLSHREFAILYELLQNAGRVLSHERLVQKVYGWAEVLQSNTIEVYIHHLRRKLSPDMIRTVRGVGYIIEKIAKEPVV